MEESQPLEFLTFLALKISMVAILSNNFVSIQLVNKCTITSISLCSVGKGKNTSQKVGHFIYLSFHTVQKSRYMDREK